MAMGRLVDGGKETDFYNGDLEEEEDGYRGWALPTASGTSLVCVLFGFSILSEFSFPSLSSTCCATQLSGVRCPIAYVTSM